MSAYTFTIAENADPAAVAKYQADLAKLRPACTSCGKTLTARELSARVVDPRSDRGAFLASTCVCADRVECTYRACYANGPGVRLDGTRGASMDIAGYRALRKYQAARKTTKREDVREHIATPAPIVSTPVPVDTPVPVVASYADVPRHPDGRMVHPVVAVAPPSRVEVLLDAETRGEHPEWGTKYVATTDVDRMATAWDDFLAPVPERETSLIATYARMFVGSPS